MATYEENVELCKRIASGTPYQLTDDDIVRLRGCLWYDEVYKCITGDAKSDPLAAVLLARGWIEDSVEWTRERATETRMREAGQIDAQTKLDTGAARWQWTESGKQWIIEYFGEPVPETDDD